VSESADPSPATADNRISVRELARPTRREIEVLAELFDQYRVHYGESPDRARSACWLDENLSASHLRAFVAGEGGKLVGFATIAELPASLRLSHFWQVRDLFVLPTHRRLGLARSLLATIRQAAIASGAIRLVVQTEEDNDPALRLYTGGGYAPNKGYLSLMLPLSSQPRQG
jgi:GNAT superfamily N-acetyltransferase